MEREDHWVLQVKRGPLDIPACLGSQDQKENGDTSDQRVHPAQWDQWAMRETSVKQGPWDHREKLDLEVFLALKDALDPSETRVSPDWKVRQDLREMRD